MMSEPGLGKRSKVVEHHGSKGTRYQEKEKEDESTKDVK